MDKAKEVTGEVVDKTTGMLTKLSCAGKRKEAANTVKFGLDSTAVASQAKDKLLKGSRKVDPATASLLSGTPSDKVDAPMQPLVGHTFTFRIGTIRPTKFNRWTGPIVNTCLPGKVVNFRCSTKHESLYVDGVRNGGRAGRLLESTTLGPDGRIETMTIGLSTSSLRNAWGGGMVANFNNLTVSSGGERRKVAVEAELIAPNKLGWTYDRKKLGLELFLTGVSFAQTKAASDVPISYTFTLASPQPHEAKTQGLEFNETEFRAFWDWLTLIRGCESANRLPMQVLLDAAAEASMAAGGAGLGAGMAGCKAGLNAGAGVAKFGAGLVDKATCGAAGAVASKAAQATGGAVAAAAAGAKAAGSAAGSAAAASTAVARSAGAAAVSGASAAAAAGASAGGSLVSAGGSLGGSLANKAGSLSRAALEASMFKGEKPVDDETGETEVGQDITRGDRDYHMARFGTGPRNRVLRLDDTNPFTIASWGGYSAVIVRHGEEVAPILFAIGEQIDLSQVSFEELCFPEGHKISDEIGQLAIASALRDTELLYEMGLATQAGHYEDAESKVVVEFLKVAGLRRVACDEVLREEVDWDIYQIAAGLRTPAVLLAAVICAAIQILSPAAVFYANIKQEITDLHDISLGLGEITDPTNVLVLTFLKFIFVMYNLVLELRELDGDAGSRLTLFLAALPQFSTTGLCLGAICNFVARLMVSVCIVLVMLVSTSPVDIVLNSLALSFIVLVDNEAIMPGWIEDLHSEQKARRYQMQTKDVRLFQRIITHASVRAKVEIDDEEVATLVPPPDFLARYPERLMGVYRVVSWMVCRINILALGGGCCYILWQGNQMLKHLPGSTYSFDFLFDWTNVVFGHVFGSDSFLSPEKSDPFLSPEKELATAVPAS